MYDFGFALYLDLGRILQAVRHRRRKLLINLKSQKVDKEPKRLMRTLPQLGAYNTYALLVIFCT